MSNQDFHKLSCINEEPSNTVQLSVASQPDRNPSTMNLKSSMNVKPAVTNGEINDDGTESDSTTKCDTEAIEESDLLLKENGDHQNKIVESSSKNETSNPTPIISKSEPIMVDESDQSVHLEPNVVVSNSASQLDETDDEQHACFFNRPIHNESLLNNNNNKSEVKKSEESGKEEVKKDESVEVKSDEKKDKEKPAKVKVHACFFNRPVEDEPLLNDDKKTKVKPDENNAAAFEAEFGVHAEGNENHLKEDIEAINKTQPIDNNAASFEAEFGVDTKSEDKTDTQQIVQDSAVDSNKSESEDKNLKHKFRHAIDSPRRWFNQIRSKQKSIKKDKYDHPRPFQRFLHAFGISNKSETEKEEDEAGPSNSSFHKRLRQPRIRMTSSATTLKKKPFNVLGKIPEEAPNQKHDDVHHDEEETTESNQKEVKQEKIKNEEPAKGSSIEVEEPLSKQEKEEIVEAVETLQELCQLEKQVEKLQNNEYKI